MSSHLPKAGHIGHLVQWTTWEGMSYRLYCHTCRKYTDLITQWAKDLGTWIFGKDEA